MLPVLNKNQDMVVPTWERSNGQTVEITKEIVCSYLDTVTTSFGRATHYNSREDQQKAELSSHVAMMNFDRDLYALFAMLPGSTDRSSQLVVKNLLGNPSGYVNRMLDPGMEAKVIYHLTQTLPPQRMLKIFEAFRHGDEKQGISKANNARTRKLILRSILGSPKLELWSVKYRSKMRTALTHAWGQSKASIVRSILDKHANHWTTQDKEILRKDVTKYADKKKSTLECVAFVLGAKRTWSLPLIKAFGNAKVDLKKGKTLPPEVLEGIRSTYHKDIPKETVIELTKRTMTKTQRKNVQSRAKAADIEVEFNPMDYNAIELYLYGFERGFDDEVLHALEARAEEAVKTFPNRFESIGILVDGSKSMEGDKTQPLRPLASVLAMKDMLQKTARNAYVGYPKELDRDKPKPTGDTALAPQLIQMLKLECDSIFVLSDGYENAPAGRCGEVLEAARSIGINTPVYHINPVFAAEVGGVREIAPNLASTLPVNRPDALGTTFIRGLLEQDIERGVNALLNIAYPKLLNGGK